MKRLSQTLMVAGSVAILLGSLDPMEGSLLILPGSGLVALGAHLGQADPQTTKFWLTLFVLNAVGVGELWQLTAFGGFGGNSGHSLWWGVLILPYVAGWVLAVARILATVAEFVVTRVRSRRAGPQG